MNARSKSKTKISKNFTTVTVRLLKLIETGVAPWRQPWHNINYQNLITQKDYTGINPVLCKIDCLYFGYSSPYYIGKAQCNERGWQIKKGSKANWLRWGGGKTITEEVRDARGQLHQKEKFISAFKWLMVFNTDCIDDSRSEVKIADFITRVEPRSSIDPIKDSEIEAFVRRINADIIYGGNQAYHVYEKNKIYIPLSHQFTSREGYWATLFHELIHWTATPDKLDRPCCGDLKNPIYHQEELVADLGASFLGNYFGFASIELEHHASYLSHYWSLLNLDPQAFFRAAYKAQKAADYLLKLGGLESDKPVKLDESVVTGKN